jgi:tRNA(Ile)-lysidine synthase
VTKQTDKVLVLPTRIAAQVAKQKLLHGVKRLGLAVSGGADSLALLHLMLPICQAADVDVHVLHLNHKLRGRASDADQRFVEGMARAYGVGCVAARAAPRALPGAADRRNGNPSLEMWARATRLAFFRQCVTELRLDAIATAHHADDVAETLMLRLARGAGMAGLAGIRPRSVLRATDAGTLVFIRPLLACTRSQLRAWLRRHGRTWREDASNRDLTIPRNRLRQVVLPWLEKKWQPALRLQLARSAEILRAEDDWLNTQAEAALMTVTGPRGALRRAALMRLPLALQRRVARLWLMAKGCQGDDIGFDAVTQILEHALKKGSGHRVQGSGFRVQGSGGTVAIPGSTILAGVRVTVRLAPGIVRQAGPIGRLPAACSISPAALAGRRLELRFRRPGDRMAPLGMQGSRKVQDILVDAKVPAAARDKVPLLVCGDEIVWLPGYRVARTFAVRDADAPAIQVRFAPVRRAT